MKIIYLNFLVTVFLLADGMQKNSDAQLSPLNNLDKELKHWICSFFIQDDLQQSIAHVVRFGAINKKTYGELINSELLPRLVNSYYARYYHIPLSPIFSKIMQSANTNFVRFLIKDEVNLFDCKDESSIGLCAHDASGHSPLFYVKEPKQQKLLLSYGANPDCQHNKKRRTALMYYLLLADHYFLENYSNMLQRLISLVRAPRLFLRLTYVNQLLTNSVRPADPNLQDKKGRTALHYAAMYGYESITKKLIECKADIEKQDNKGATPLLEAVSNNCTGTTKILLDAGANSNHVTHIGISALCVAVLDGNKEITKLLLNNKADPNLAAKSGITPLIIAHYNGHRALEQLLEEYSAKEYD